MSDAVTSFIATLRHRFSDQIQHVEQQTDMPLIEVPAEHLLDVSAALRDEPIFEFTQLTDLTAVDHLEYGVTHWQTHDATSTGYSRGVHVQDDMQATAWDKPRFVVVYHLLSIPHNRRLRMKVFLDEKSLKLPSVVDIWPGANWFERETYDLFGVVFEGHPDLRRLLTDYGFEGHPFRKDFPLVGHVELRYDAAEERCVYGPVSIQPRTLVPKVIRQDNRYGASEAPVAEEQEHEAA